MHLLIIFQTSRRQSLKDCLKSLKKSRSLCSHLVSVIIAQKANKALDVRLHTAERLFVNKLDPYDEGILGTVSTLWLSVDRIYTAEDAAAIFLKAEFHDVALPPVKAEVKEEDMRMFW